MAATPNLPEADLNGTQTRTERALTIACCCIVGVTMILRTLGRYCLKLKNYRERISSTRHFLGLDDIFNVFAVATFYALCIAVLIAVDRGMGVHLERVMQEHGQKGFDSYNLAIYVCALSYNSTLGFVKLSVLSLYRRILFGVPRGKLQILNWTVFIIVSLNTTINVCVAAFQCRPIKGAFDSSVKPKCIDPNAFYIVYIGNAITGIITDSMVYSLAIPIVKPLNMEPRRKIITLLTLLVGAFAVVTSCIRLAFLPALLSNPDTTWAMGVPMEWSVVEPEVGIFVSSVPAITAIRHFSGSKIYVSNGSNNSTLQSQKHIQLQDFRSPDGTSKTTVSANRKRRVDSRDLEDSGSEEHLVHDKSGSITVSRTMEVQLSYGPR